MRLSGVKPTRSTYGSVLSVCAHLIDLVLGQQIHSEVIKLGLDKNRMLMKFLLQWIIEILSSGMQFLDAMHKHCCLASLLNSSFQPDEVTPLRILVFSMLVHVCPSLTWLGSCNELGNALIDMYGKLGNIEDARQQFDLMVLKDTITWNSMVAGYVQGNDVDEAIFLFCQMMWEGISPDEVSFACALIMLANLDALEADKQIHASAIKSGFELTLYVGITLVHMYAKCASIEEAHNILAQMPESNIVSRNALVAGYVQNDQGMEAIDVFRQMQAA
ncbi:hypothetical protein EJ110_NYTH22359 [Nymphaea thermarum]|nr:hypothetical protein EJ110_NYTH22359 [Nymphaea thermarum]